MKKRNKQKCEEGGILSTMQALTPLLSLIPGAGPLASMGASAGLGLLSNQINSPATYQPIGPNTSKYGYAMGGQLQQLGPNTQQVQATNPGATDSVELPQAYVNHGETISGVGGQQYVFSDTLKHPITGKTFADEDKKLAKADANAQKKYNDPAAAKALEWNQKNREQLMNLNELMKLAESYGKGVMKAAKNKMAYGGVYGDPPLDPLMLPLNRLTSAQAGPYEPNAHYALTAPNSASAMNSSLLNLSNPSNPRPPASGTYAKGYSAPWDGFNVANFQKFAGFKGKQWDNVYGPETHKAWEKYGNDYATEQFMGTSSDGKYVPGEWLNTNTNANPEPLPIPSGAERRAQGMDPRSLGRSGIPPVTSTTPQNIRGQVPALDAAMKPNAPGANQLGQKVGAAELLQYGELAAKIGLLARGYDKQELYQNSAPVTLRGYDPSNQLQQSALGYNKARSDIQGAASGLGSYLGNMQGAAANNYQNNSNILSQYANMNQQAQVNYEQRLGQRSQQNIATRLGTDQIRQQDEASYHNSIQDILTSFGNVGRGKVAQNENKKAVELILSAFPDIAKYMRNGQ